MTTSSKDVPSGGDAGVDALKRVRGSAIRRPIVCGGRNYADRGRVYETLDRLNVENNFLGIIQGGATGADSLARDWCASRMVEYQNIPADWKKHGYAAGPIRNQRMIDETQADACIAFPGWKGTADMVKRAKAAGLTVIIVAEPLPLQRPKPLLTPTPTHKD